MAEHLTLVEATPQVDEALLLAEAYDDLERRRLLPVEWLPRAESFGPCVSDETHVATLNGPCGDCWARSYAA